MTPLRTKWNEQNNLSDHIARLLDILNIVYNPDTHFLGIPSDENRPAYLISLLVDFFDGGSSGPSYGASWALDGNNLTSEKWFGTITDFDIPIKTHDIEMGRWLTDAGGLSMYLSEDKGTFLVDHLNQIFAMGDYTQTPWGNQSKLYIDDVDQLIKLSTYDSNLGASVGMTASIHGGSEQVIFGDIDVTSMWTFFDWTLGEMGFAGNLGGDIVKLVLNYNNQTLAFTTQLGDELFFLDNVNKLIRFYKTYTFDPNDGNAGDVLTTDGAGLWSMQAAAADSNFANTDLTFTGDRTHDFNGKILILTDAGQNFLVIDPIADIIEYTAPNGHNFSGDIGIGGNADTVAALDVQSTTKGFLPPRMTTAERTGIAAVEGLTIYDIDIHGLFFYDGTNWVQL